MLRRRMKPVALENTLPRASVFVLLHEGYLPPKNDDGPHPGQSGCFTVSPEYEQNGIRPINSRSPLHRFLFLTQARSRELYASQPRPFGSQILQFHAARREILSVERGHVEASAGRRLVNKTYLCRRCAGEVFWDSFRRIQ